MTNPLEGRMINRANISLGLGFFTALMTSACGDGLPGLAQNSPYPIKDSGYFIARGASAYRLYWLDTERVLFSAYSPALNKDLRRGEPFLGPLALYVWDVRRDRVTWHSEVLAGVGCHYNGFVTYAVTKTDSGTLIREGQFGKEEEIHITAEEMERKREQGAAIRNRFTCRPYSTAQYPRRQGYRVVPLLDAHGYLEVARNDPESGVTVDRPIMFHRTGDGTPIELPILSKEQSNEIRYYEFINAYAIYGNVPKDGSPVRVTNWPKGKSHPLYLLSPEGDVKTIEIPYGKTWGRGSGDYLPTKVGVVIASWDIKNAQDIGDAGAYLLRDGRVETLIRGY